MVFGSAPSRKFPAFRQGRRRRLITTILCLAGAGICTFCLGFASVFVYLDPKIPSIETYRHYRYETPLRIHTRDGALIAEFGRRLIPIDLTDVPERFLQGLIGTEDKRFYWHFGIDPISLLNDTVGLLTSDVRTGASTITMQLAKVVSFDREQVFIRKFKEMLTALEIERELEKDEILALYVNIMSFGKNAYGIQAAAHTYYGKPAAELTLAQLAMLAGILKKPEGGNPINGPEWALQRRNLVLRRMRSQGAITGAEYAAAAAAPITARVFRRGIDLPAPYPAEWVRQQLYREHGQDIYSGVVVHTTLDAKMQAAAQRALRNGLLDYDRRHGYRGPAGRVDLAILPRDETASADALAVALAPYPPSGDVEAVAITGVAERGATAARRNGEAVALEWDGLRWARPFLGTDSLGPRPREAGDVIAPGDVVYARPADGQWRLSQWPQVQGALVALDSRTGGVRAMVGGWDFGANQFNHALQARRQPGSGFKPFVYSAALANGISAADRFWDLPLLLESPDLEADYRPRNSDGFSEEQLTLRRGLYRSKNVISIRVLLEVGLAPTIEHVTKFGFARERLPRNTQLAIGGGEMAFTPLQMATGYAVIANGGYRVRPHIIDRVERQDGTPMFTARHPRVCEPCDDVGSPPPVNGTTPTLATPKAARVLDARNAFIMRSILGDVIRKGTGARAGKAFERSDLGGKTGTTDDATDTWFNGFHPNLVATAWVGFSDGRPTGKFEFGSKSPLTIWIDFMREALADEPATPALMPPGVVSVRVDPTTGSATTLGADAMFEFFFEEHAPETAKDRRRSLDRRDDGRARPRDVF